MPTITVTNIYQHPPFTAIDNDRYRYRPTAPQLQVPLRTRVLPMPKMTVANSFIVTND